jgi:hypothetical protein
MTQTVSSSPSKPRTKHRLRFRLHPGQREVRESKARFRVVACGRQWGKTYFGTRWALAGALIGKAVWWVAPDFPLASIGWKEIKRIARAIPGANVSESERLITFAGGGWLQVKSAHNEGSLRGVGLGRLVVDEAAFIPEERWHSELRPTLAIHAGEALFISTFSGENWFYDLYELGQDPEEHEWQSWRKPSTDSPYFPPDEIERARAGKTPEAHIQQEYFANPLVYVGSVFPGERVAEAQQKGYETDWEAETSEAFAGLDWGWTNPTAFLVCQEDAGTGRVSWLHEQLWTATDIDVRVNHMVDMCRERNVLAIYADAASPADNARLGDALDRAELPTEVVAVPFGQYKDRGIKTRRWYLESGLEVLSPECPTLISETKKYHFREGTEDVEKTDDHTCDAATAFYSSRLGAMLEERASL